MFLACFSSRLLFLWPEDITCASRGKASPVRRQICGDREHLQRLIPRPGACCHLTVSHCFDLTFAFCPLSSKSSPQLCCCRFKLCIRKDMQSLQMIADKEYYSKARMKPLASQYIYVFELSFLCSRPDFGFCKKCDAALLPKENTEPDEFPAARPGAAFGVVGPAQICSVMGRRIDMITYPYRLAAPPGSTATQLNPLSTRAELKHSSSPRSILSKQGGFVSHEGRCIPLRPCQRKHYYCLPMPLEKKKRKYIQYAYYSNTSRQCLELLCMIA